MTIPDQKGPDQKGVVPDVTARGDRAMRGQQAWHSGIAAEDAVARHYQRAGSRICARRWRKGGGEIDLIVQEDGCLVFVEVKKARDFDRAAESLSSRQIRRLHQGAESYLATQPAGSLTECRFDVALVNGQGEIRILENAF